MSLECRDALEVVRDYGKHPNVLLYCDPPYLATSRNSTNYRHEMGSVEDHRALADELANVACSVVLSGYDSPLYSDLYAGWSRIEMSAWTGNGIRNGAATTAGNRTEVLWSNRLLGSGTCSATSTEVPHDLDLRLVRPTRHPQLRGLPVARASAAASTRGTYLRRSGAVLR